MNNNEVKDDFTIINCLQKTINQRKTSQAGLSYVASLLQGTPDKALKKVAEEAGELIIAAGNLHHEKNEVNRKAVISEAADLLFHSQIALACFNIEMSEVAQELCRREGVSGHVEKTSRKSGISNPL